MAHSYKHIEGNSFVISSTYILAAVRLPPLYESFSTYRIVLLPCQVNEWMNEGISR